MRKSPVYLPYDALERECRFETLRRSGPGGQNRNKVETGVRFYHLASGLVGEATERRRQIENRKTALERLRLNLALTLREPPSVEVDSNRGTDARRLANESDFVWFGHIVSGKLRAARDSFDYAIMVAEFFDVYYAVGENLGAAATALRVSTSQIVRFLALAPKALEALNASRLRNGLTRLRP